jgi:hypothetical protein
VEAMKSRRSVQIAVVSSQLTDFKQHINIAKIKNGKLTQRQKNYTIDESAICAIQQYYL